MSEIFNDENKLLFQIKRFVSYYWVYTKFIEKKSFIKELSPKFFASEDLMILLLNNLNFLFDENKPESFLNIRFQKHKLEEQRIEILKDWSLIKEEIKKITDNVGFLKYETHENLRVGYFGLRRLDNKVLDFMEKIKEFNYSFFHITYSEDEF